MRDNRPMGRPVSRQAHNFITEIVELPEDAPEAEIAIRLYIVLRHLYRFSAMWSLSGLSTGVAVGAWVGNGFRDGAVRLRIG